MLLPVHSEVVQHHYLPLGQLLPALAILVQPVVKPDLTILPSCSRNVRRSMLLHIGLESPEALHPAGCDIPVHTDGLIALLCPWRELVLPAPDLAVIIVHIPLSDLISCRDVQMAVLVIELFQRGIIIVLSLTKVLDEISGLRCDVEELLHFLVVQVHFLPDALDEIHSTPHGCRIAGDVKNERMLSFRGDGKRPAQLLKEDTLGFGRPQHDHAVEVIKVDTFSQHVNHKKKPQAVGIIRRKARISVSVLDVHLIAVDFIRPAKPVGADSFQRPYVLYSPAEDDELAAFRMFAGQRLFKCLPQTGSRLQMASCDSGVILLPLLFCLIELDHADPVDRQRKKAVCNGVAQLHFRGDIIVEQLPHIAAVHARRCGREAYDLRCGIFAKQVLYPAFPLSGTSPVKLIDDDEVEIGEKMLKPRIKAELDERPRQMGLVYLLGAF